MKVKNIGDLARNLLPKFILSMCTCMPKFVVLGSTIWNYINTAKFKMFYLESGQELRWFGFLLSICKCIQNYDACKVQSQFSSTCENLILLCINIESESRGHRWFVLCRFAKALKMTFVRLAVVIEQFCENSDVCKIELKFEGQQRCR